MPCPAWLPFVIQAEQAVHMDSVALALAGAIMAAIAINAHAPGIWCVVVFGSLHVLILAAFLLQSSCNLWSRTA